MNNWAEKQFVKENLAPLRLEVKRDNSHQKFRKIELKKLFSTYQKLLSNKFQNFIKKFNPSLREGLDPLLPTCRFATGNHETHRCFFIYFFVRIFRR